ncbi:MAG TPA: hypothetical protein PKW49_11830, partial [Paludibacteraceae bacterium]|nr:hypothetical protein [Paludibacteraceae bacterium]
MKTEKEKNIVYFSDCFKKDYMDIYEEISDILSKNGLDYGTLPKTKDYWCRDFMPVEVAENDFVQFTYDPDYLKHEAKYKTNVQQVLNFGDSCLVKNMENTVCPLIVDGGNVVVCHERPKHPLKHNFREKIEEEYVNTGGKTYWVNTKHKVPICSDTRSVVVMTEKVLHENPKYNPRFRNRKKVIIFEHK